MNKFIFCLVLLFTVSLYAQEEDTALEFDEDGMDANTSEVQNPDSNVPDEIIEESKTSENIEEIAPEPKTVDELASEPKTVDELATAPDISEKEIPVEPIEAVLAPAQPKPTKPVFDPVLVSVEEYEKTLHFTPNESHWYTTFGFEAMEYNLPFNYDGEKKDFSKDQRQLYGGRLGFGGEIYLGAGFLTSTRLEGYYMGTLFESAKTADPELEDEDVATVKDTGQIYGFDLVQTFSFIWELKTKNPVMDEMTYLTVEPFIEVGVGRAWAYNQKDYNYNTSIKEEYDQSFNDELTNSKIGGGFNFTSRQGFFMYLKATQNRYDITKRRTKGYYYRNGTTTHTPVNDDPSTDLPSIMVYSLGGGYKF